MSSLRASADSLTLTPSQSLVDSFVSNPVGMIFFGVAIVVAFGTQLLLRRRWAGRVFAIFRELKWSFAYGITETALSRVALIGCPIFMLLGTFLVVVGTCLLGRP